MPNYPNEHTSFTTKYKGSRVDFRTLTLKYVVVGDARPLLLENQPDAAALVYLVLYWSSYYNISIVVYILCVGATPISGSYPKTLESLLLIALKKVYYI